MVEVVTCQAQYRET